LAQELSVSNYVVFEGFQPQEKIPSYIIASSIGLIPHLKTAHTDNTIPHKLFHYMLMNKPVVAANCNPIERILSESNAGLIYRSNNEKDLADKIIQLYKNNSLRIEMGENGRKAVLEKYNWSITIKNLTNLYKNIELKVTQNKKFKD
jgi:glycosyltransferase involved in cell wall biosynthesis